jgi:hypothetical protein
VLHDIASPRRGAVEAFLAAAYGRAFDSVLRRHYPTLLSLEDPCGRIAAAVGVRLAREEPLFLERYLDVPVEVAASAALGARVGREQVAEIGNLASTGPTASVRLFVAVAEHLVDRGCLFAAATATRQLRRKFTRMGFATTALTQAEPSRLGPDVADWGGYYARDPEVRVGLVGPALRRLREMQGDGDGTGR